MKITGLGLALIPALLLTQSSSHAQKQSIRSRVSADAVCSFVVNKMMSALPQVPTLCVVKQGDQVGYELSVFSPTEVLEGKMRRAWSTALFLSAQSLFFDGALNGTCEFSNEDKHWYGCQLNVSDSYLSQYHVRYVLWVDQQMKEAMQNVFADPSSDDWYRTWWDMLAADKEVSDARFESKGNAELIAEEACKEYLQHPEFKLGLFQTPTCSVLFVTDSSVYVVLEFADWLNAKSANLIDLLPGTFGKVFATSAYNGAVICRTSWDVGNSSNRVYDMYPLRAIEFSWEEASSGVRDTASATLLLAGKADSGQTDRYVLSSSKTAHRGAAAVMRLTVLQGTNRIVVDLTDGSEWSVPSDSATQCGLSLGTAGIMILIPSGDSEKITPMLIAKRGCANAAFVASW